LTVTVDFVADFGAPTNGTSDCSTAVAALNTFMLTHNDVILTVPAHVYNITQSVTFGLSAGNTTLVVQGTGATFTTLSGGFAWFLGGVGIGGTAPGSSARMIGANAGDTVVALTIVGDASLFTAGRYVLVTAFDMFGGSQYPTDQLYFEYAKVLSVDTVGGSITLTAPLKYSYLPDFPLYSAGDGSHPDNGGPATVYPLPASWDIDIQFIGLTFAHNLNAQISIVCRKATFTSCTCTSTAGIIPSQNQTFTFDSCDLSVCSIEADKMVETFTADNTTISQLAFQSASVTNFISNAGLTTSFNGTARNSNIAGATLTSVLLAPSGYGPCDSFRLFNSTCTSVGGLNACRDTNIASLGITVDPSGLITDPNNANPTSRWASPRGRLIFSGGVSGASGSTNDCEATILSVTKDAILGTLTRTTPLPSWQTAPTEIMAHPCPSLYFENVTGCLDAVDLSQVKARGGPLYSYSKRVYTGDNSGAMLKLSGTAGPILWGKIRTITITVSQAYTGALTLTMEPFGSLRQINHDTGAASTWNPTIDLKTVGVRTITKTNVIGAVGADSITVPGNLWFCEDQPVVPSRDVSGDSSALWPIVTIEIETNQEFLPLAVTPLRMRLHA